MRCLRVAREHRQATRRCTATWIPPPLSGPMAYSPRSFARRVGGNSVRLSYLQHSCGSSATGCTCLWDALCEFRHLPHSRVWFILIMAHPFQLLPSFLAFSPSYPVFLVLISCLGYSAPPPPRTSLLSFVRNFSTSNTSTITNLTTIIDNCNTTNDDRC